MLAAFKRRLTFANVVAVIALFVALGGSVYAGNKISGKTIKKNSEPGNRIKKGSEPGNRLKKDSVTGKQVKEPTLATVPSAKTAVSADPVAFAKVSANGVVDVANSKGVAQSNVTFGGHPPSPGSAQYCFSGLPFQPRGGQATVENQGTGPGYPTIQFGLGGAETGCADGTQAFVYTPLSNGTAQDSSFFVVFYR